MTDKVDFTNFSRHQNLFNTLRNMGYILLESELQEVVSAVEKDKIESGEIDFNKLRDEFFNECTLQKCEFVNGNLIRTSFVSFAPHDLFEWFKKKLTTKL